MNELMRYRFKTRAVDDYRPLVDMKDIGMPWWCTGEAFDMIPVDRIKYILRRRSNNVS